MGASKRRTAAQIAADAQAAYRARVAAQHAAAVKRSDDLHARSEKLRQDAEHYAKEADIAECQADRLAFELSRLDAAAALLTADDATADTLMAAANALPVEA